MTQNIAPHPAFLIPPDQIQAMAGEETLRRGQELAMTPRGVQLWVRPPDRLEAAVHDGGFLPVHVAWKATGHAPAPECKRCGRIWCAHAVAALLVVQVRTAPVGKQDSRPFPQGVLEVATWKVRELDGSRSLDAARLSFRYGALRVRGEWNPEPFSGLVEGRWVAWSRDREHEGKLVAQLAGSGLERASVTGLWVPLHGNWADWITDQAPGLRLQGWDIGITGALAAVRIDDASWELRLEAESRPDWFRLVLGVRVENEVLDLAPLFRELLQRDEPDLVGRLRTQERPVLVSLPNGRHAALPAARVAGWLEVLLGIAEEGRGGTLTVDAMRAGQLVCEIPQGFRTRLPAQVETLARTLAARTEAPDLEAGDLEVAGLQASLRPYQRRGAAWLVALESTGMGGILADDMGLGKTLQAIVFLVMTRRRRGDRLQDLVVCPTSLVGNWKREWAKFHPDSRVIAWHGPDRRRLLPVLDDAEVVLCTYPLLHRDQELLASRSFGCVVFDEAHVLKNSSTAAATAARSLAARVRVALSGTPVENHLGELWSLVDLVAPGALGTKESFRTRFQIPVERHGDDSRRLLLARRVAPFVLRRTKESVLPELPPRTDILRTVTFDEPQRDLYEALRAACDRRVRDEVARVGLKQSGAVVLEALLRLRQCCCDPRLLPQGRNLVATDSAKLASLLDLLEELLSENRQVLVFSQFAAMIALIADELHSREVPHAVLTGSTRDREEEVRRFQEGQARVFLLSLKAGGTGLNLAAADTVILYDPWWNPAVEAQAIDRSHRMGQDRPVFAVRLMAEGTVEEKVLSLQERKRILASGVVGEGAPPALTVEDLAELLG